MLVVIEELSVFEQVDLPFFWRLEVLHLENDIFPVVHFSLLLVPNFDYRHIFQFFGGSLQVLFNIEDRPLLDEGVLRKILEKQLRNDFKVLLVVLKQNFNLLEYLFDVGQLKLIVMDQLHNIEYFLLHGLLLAYGLLHKAAQNARLEIPLKSAYQVFELVSLFGGDAAVLTPHFSLSFEFGQIFVQKNSVCFAEVVVVSGEAFLSSFHGVEGFSIVLELQVADSHVGKR